MGNLCGKQDAEPTSPGRVLGSAPPRASQPKRAPVPASVGGPPRTLGSQGASSSGDARQRAAEAAEARAKAASSKGGKLQSQLEAQKRQSRNDILKQASAQQQRARDADDAARARAWD
ncbi:hypothetical protein CDD82_3962 [Ophiocordyceps australis]|uniref:Uncharacterized protein n=1 Tax=Ophiocordyceps australis TaxID=1399860 RepID=A0A2C5Z9X6_9HYPO|nr:hypothetical protein CDD82_3962 [Ophiocordyceps australis]